jgi:membrane associated rhomboid family serine protease
VNEQRREETEWPWATIGISVAICLVFLAESALGLEDETGDVTLTRVGATSAALVLDAGEWWRLFAAAFVHGGFLHVFLNGIALIQLGVFVEELYGRSRFLVIFLLSCLGSSLATSTIGSTPSVGASGGIMGLMGFLIAARYTHEPEVRSFLRAVLGRQLIFWAGLAFAIGGSLQLAYVVRAIPSPVIDNYGHMGGLVTGAALALVLRSTGRQGLLVHGAAAALVVAAAGSLGMAALRGEESARLEQAFLDVAALDTSGGGVRRGLDQLASPEKARRVVGRDPRRAQQLVLGAIAALDTRSALQFAEIAATLDPVRGSVSLAQARLSAGDERGAQAAIGAFGSAAGASDLVAVAMRLEDLGRSREAVWFYEAAVARDPDDPELLNALAWTLVVPKDAAARDAKRALVVARRAVELGSDVPAWMRLLLWVQGSNADQVVAARLDTLAEAEFQNGLIHEALGHEERAVELDRAAHDAQLADLEERLNKIRAAAR